MKLFKWFRTPPPRPSAEALRERAAVEVLRPRVERAVSERGRRLAERTQEDASGYAEPDLS